MANLIIGGVPNPANSGMLTVTADSEADSTNMPDDNLLTIEPSEIWRSASNAPTRSGFLLSLANTYQTISWDHVALVATNMSLYTYGSHFQKWRIVSCDSTVPVFFEDLAPNSTVATSNTTGAYTDVDEGFSGSADGNDIGPTVVTSVWDITLGFPTPAATPRSGGGSVDYQFFVVEAYAVGAGGNLTVGRSEGGVYHGDLRTVRVTSTSKRIFIFSWDANDLSTPSGIDAEILVTGDPGATASDYVKVSRVGWACESTQVTGLSSPYDTGWLNPDSDPSYSTAIGTPVKPPYVNLFHSVGSTKTHKYIRVCMVDDQQSFSSSVNTPYLVPDGYVQAGCVVLGAGFSPATNRDYGSLVGVKDLSFKGVTHGGQTYGSKRARLRTMELPMSWLTAAEAHALFDRLLWRKSILDPVLVSIIPNDATEGFHTTFLATVDEAMNMMGAPSFDVRTLSLKLLEKI